MKNLISPARCAAALRRACRSAAALLLAALTLCAVPAAAFAEQPEPRRVISIAEILGGAASGYGTPTSSPTAYTGAVSAMTGAKRAEAELDAGAKLIAEHLGNEMGFNSAAVAGILANIQSESLFDPKTVGDGGASFGICQWHGARRQKLMAYCEEKLLDPSTLSAQLGFLDKELTEDYPETLRILRGSRNDAGGADNAAYFFCTDYEAPSELETEIRLRCSLAREYYAILSRYESQELSVSQLEAELITADFLRNELQLNSAAAAGVMSNIMEESGFSPMIIGDRGTAVGICQWSGERLIRYERFCKRNAYDMQELYSQLDFLKDEMQTYFPETLRVLRGCSNDLEGAKYAAYIFCKNYEAPRDLNGAMRARRSITENVYYPMLNMPMDDIGLLCAASERAKDYIAAQSSVGIGSVCPEPLERKLLSSAPREIYSAN